VDADGNRRTIERLLEVIDAGRVDDMDDLFHDDAVMEWPQSGERVVGAVNRRAIYARFPSLPAVQARRIRCSGDLCVAEATLTYEGGDAFQAIFVFELRDGKIAHETGYWASPFEAPEWRAAWVDRATSV
jgi:ketosteroid isomerase-like protein